MANTATPVKKEKKLAPKKLEKKIQPLKTLQIKL